jgi:hypothetical protein
MWVIGIIAVLLAIVFIVQGNQPEFFDLFGLVVFAFLFWVGYKMLKSRKRLPDWVGFVILLIAILGIIVDGYIVIKTYIMGA